MGIEKMKEKRSGLAKAVWAAILQLLGVFGRRKRERERASSLAVTQHYAAGQDGGGEIGEKEEREDTGWRSGGSFSHFCEALPFWVL